MGDKKCDISQVRAEAMRSAQAKAKQLKAAGVPVTKEVFGELVRNGYRKAEEVCKPANMELTPDQAGLVGELCEPCQRFYQVRGQAKLEMEAKLKEIKARGAAESEPESEKPEE